MPPNKIIRAAGIVIKDENILLMYRERGDEKYFVFPGGGVREDETTEQAVLREVFEECSVKIEVEKLLYRCFIKNSDQYFYKCKFISGEIRLGNFNELEADKKGGNIHKPAWFPLKQLNNIVLYPLEIRDRLAKDTGNSEK